MPVETPLAVHNETSLLNLRSQVLQTAGDTLVQFADQLNQIELGLDQTLAAEVKSLTLNPEVVKRVLQFPPDKQTQAIVLLSTTQASFNVLLRLSGKTGGLDDQSQTKPTDSNLSLAEQVAGTGDRLSSAIIQACFKSCLPPGYGVFDEESGGNVDGKDIVAVADPLDASTAYKIGKPDWAVGANIWEKTDVDNGGLGVTFGVVFTPTEDLKKLEQGEVGEFLFGGKGLGTFDSHGNQLITPEKTQTDLTIIHTGSRDIRQRDWLATLQVLSGHAQRTYAGAEPHHATVAMLSRIAKGLSQEAFEKQQQPLYDIGPAIALAEGMNLVVELKAESGYEQDANTYPDKKRRHHIFIGTPQIATLRSEILKFNLDSPINLSGISLAEALRTGTKLQTQAIFPVSGKQALLAVVDRFGCGQTELDFAASKILNHGEILASRERKRAFVSIPAHAMREIYKILGKQYPNEYDADFEVIPMEAITGNLSALDIGLNSSDIKPLTPRALGNHFNVETAQTYPKTKVFPKGAQATETCTVTWVDLTEEAKPNFSNQLEPVDLEILLNAVAGMRFPTDKKVEINGKPLSQRLVAYLIGVASDKHPNHEFIVSPDQKFYWTQEK